ncbi:hypothetical protein L7F22_027158 [Adiantum nelumboides]|nr:hypothetical protein [Adiantum nelumboides]
MAMQESEARIDQQQRGLWAGYWGALRKETMSKTSSAASEKKLKIAICHPDLGIGGAERLIVDAAVELASRGHRVHVFTAHYDRNRCFDETKEGNFAITVYGDFLPRHIFYRLHALCAYLRCLYVALWMICLWPTFNIILVDQVSAVIPLVKCTSSKDTFQWLCKLFKSCRCDWHFSAYHPQTDGQTERVNQILEEMLRHYIQNRLASWEEYLTLVEFAYNNAPHSVTGMTPFQAAYGHTPLVPTNFVLQHKVALADQLVQEMQDILVQSIDSLKWRTFIPCKKAASAPDIASLFVQHIFRIHGLPSSAYHPQTDGQTERVNQILEEMLRHYIQNRLASWEEYLTLVEFAYNNAPHSVTGMTPFQAAYGHTPLVPTNFVLQHKVALADQLVQEMQDILVQVRDKLIHVQQKYQKQANKHRRHAEFNEGDMVLLYVASHRYKTVKSVFPKLRPRFYGPFKIIKKNSVVSYKLELPPSWGKLHPTFHISWLKQYIQGDSPVPELSSYIPEIEDEHVILVPEMILDVRQKETRRKLTTEFLVKWMDLDESDSTWQTDEEMQQYPNLLQEFFDKRQIFL